MVTKDDLDVSTLRITDSLHQMDKKINKLLEAAKIGGRKVLDTTEAKLLMNVSDSTLWRYRQRGLKSHKNEIGRRVFYYDEIMDFLRGDESGG